MKILSRFLAFAAAVLFVGSPALADGSVVYQGQTISWTGLNATSSLKSDGSVCVIKFTSGSGNVTFPGNVKAEVLAIGGGGGGSGGHTTLGRAGGGGHGGGGESNPTGTEWLKAGTYAVSIGAGGSAGSKGNDGGDGSSSTFTGNGVSITGPGGAKGTVNGGSGGGATFNSNIEDPTGAVWKDYGVGGASGKSSPSAGAANTGNGGDGGEGGTWGGGNAGAAGGSGVVVMRISRIKTVVQLDALMVYQPWNAVTKTIEDYTDTGTPTYSSSDPSVATATASISGGHLSIVVTPIKSGDTTITVDTDVHTYILPVEVWDDVTYKDQTVRYKNGSAKTDSNGDLVLVYTSGTGGAILPSVMKGDYLVVGGGGSGSMGNGVASYGSGNGGDLVYKENKFLHSGKYSMTVGVGGASLPKSSTKKDGYAGSSSTLKYLGPASGGVQTITANGGAGTDPANYSITFVKGTLRIASSEIAGLWITDHADGGPGKVHLAFALSRLNESEVSAEYVNALFAADRIKVAWGATEEDLAKAEPVVATPRADAAGAFQSETGWVWITVTLPEETSYPLLYKVLVTD